MSSCSLSYLDGMLYHAAMILCGSDTVTDLVTGWIIMPLPHNIAQLLTSPYLNCNHFICCHCSNHFCCRVAMPSRCCFVIISTPENAVYPWHLHLYCCVHSERGAQIIVCFSSHNNNSGSCWVQLLLFLGGRWPDDAWFSHRSGDGPPLVVVLYSMASDGLKMLQSCGRRWWCCVCGWVYLLVGGPPRCPSPIFLNTVPPRRCS